MPIAGTAFQSLTCECPYPEFVDTDSPDPELAPYLNTGGCVEPIRLSEVTVVSTKIEVALSKPASSEDEWTMSREWTVARDSHCLRPASSSLPCLAPHILQLPANTIKCTRLTHIPLAFATLSQAR